MAPAVVVAMPQYTNATSSAANSGGNNPNSSERTLHTIAPQIHLVVLVIQPTSTRPNFVRTLVQQFSDLLYEIIVAVIAYLVLKFWVSGLRLHALEVANG